MDEDLALFGGYAVAGLGPFAAVTILSPLRGEPSGTAVAILVLSVLIAAAAALAGPRLGLVATLSAALWFDFLFIAPYGTLKIGGDLWPIAPLIVIGLVVVMSSRRRRTPLRGAVSTTSSAPAPAPSRHIQRIVRLVEEGIDQRDLISAVQAELISLLSARGCRFEDAADVPAVERISRRRLERDGTLFEPGSPALIDGELELPVQFGTNRVGRFLLDPTPGMSLPLEHRLVAVMLTDHLAAAIGHRRTSTPPRT